MRTTNRLLLVTGLWIATRPATAVGPGIDVFGDPLPAGAVARLGTVRLLSTDSPPHALAFSPNGKTLTVLDPVTVSRWEFPGGKALPPIRVGWPATFASDGKTLASVEDLSRIALRDAATGKRL